MVDEDPCYTDFLAAVREVNLRLPADARIRVFGGDPGKTNPDREATAIAILKEQILRRQGKALVIYGAAHFYRAGSNDAVSRLGDVGIVRKLEVDYPGRTLAVIPVGGKIDLPPGVNVPTPDYQKFDRSIRTQVRPVMVPLRRLPFSDFTAEESIFGLITCVGPGGCRSAFKGSSLTLGEMADAIVYLGRP